MQPDKYGAKTIESFEPLIRLIASQIVFDPSKREDCVQEARIAVWQVLRDKPDVPRKYISVVIRNRIRLVASSNRMTGDLSGRQGKVVDPLRRAFTSIDAMAETGFALHDAIDPGADERLDAIEIRCAVLALEPDQRAYVIQRFYLGSTARSLVNKNRHWNKARERLSEELQSLVA